MSTTKSIQEQMAAALATQANEDPAAVLNRMQQRDTKEKSLLCTMIENAKVSADAKTVDRSQARVAKQTTPDTNDVRSVFALISDSREEAYIVMNKEYRNKTAETAVDVARRYMKNKKKIQLLLEAPDLRAVQYADMVPVHEAELARVQAHDVCANAEYNVLSPKPVIETV